MKGIPDGSYTVRVAAIDPITRQPFHHHQITTSVTAQKMARETEKLREVLAQPQKPRAFVTALANQPEVKIQNGRATIPIGVEDGSGIRCENFPVRLGVPLPQGVFPANSPMRLLSPQNTPVAAQFQAMSVWPDKSLKWIGVDFRADCPPDGFSFYKLEIGKGVPTAPAKPNDIARETEEYIELNTGPMLIRVPRKTLSVPEEVFIDRDKNGQFSEGEKVLLASQPGDAWWLSKDRNFTMQLKGEKSGDISPGVAIESNGPQSAVVKTTGWYLDETGKHVALGEVRVEVFRD